MLANRQEYFLEMSANRQEYCLEMSANRQESEFLVRGKKKFGVNFGLQKRGTTLYCFGVSLHF